MDYLGRWAVSKLGDPETLRAPSYWAVNPISAKNLCSKPHIPLFCNLPLGHSPCCGQPGASQSRSRSQARLALLRLLALVNAVAFHLIDNSEALKDAVFSLPHCCLMDEKAEAQEREWLAKVTQLVPSQNPPRVMGSLIHRC